MKLHEKHGKTLGGNPKVKIQVTERVPTLVKMAFMREKKNPIFKCKGCCCCPRRKPVVSYVTMECEDKKLRAMRISQMGTVSYCKADAAIGTKFLRLAGAIVDYNNRVMYMKFGGLGKWVTIHL